MFCNPVAFVAEALHGLRKLYSFPQCLGSRFPLSHGRLIRHTQMKFPRHISTGGRTILSAHHRLLGKRFIACAPEKKNLSLQSPVALLEE